MVASFYFWGTFPVLQNVGKYIIKVPDKIRVVEFQYFSWEGVWSYRFPVRNTADFPHHVIHDSSRGNSLSDELEI